MLVFIILMLINSFLLKMNHIRKINLVIKNLKIILKINLSLIKYLS